MGAIDCYIRINLAQVISHQSREKACYFCNLSIAKLLAKVALKVTFD